MAFYNSLTDDKDEWRKVIKTELSEIEAGAQKKHKNSSSTKVW